MNIKQKITSAAIIGGLAVSVLAPASSFAAQNNVKVKNNGKDSDNKVKIVDNKKVNINQVNTVVVTNAIVTISNTGGNEIKGNTGKGDSTIITGNVVNNITSTVEGNTNSASASCLCEEGNSTNNVVIKNNGKDSDNKAKIVNNNTLKVTQNSVSIITNIIGTASNTGLNSVKNNTGKGDKGIGTGNIKNTIDITVEGSTNTL